MTQLAKAVAPHSWGKGDGLIYAITNIQTQAIYIGATRRSIARRCINHLSSLRRGCHYVGQLQQDWNAFGESNFSIEILEVVKGRIGLWARESYWIAEKRSEGRQTYNAYGRRRATAARPQTDGAREP